MLELRVPDRADFPTRQAWLADPAFMSDNAGWDLAYPGYDRQTGCISWPESAWDAFGERLSLPPDRHGYYFVENGNGEALGHVHYAVDGPTAEIGFTVVPRHRGHGLGHRFLAMLVETVRRNTSVAVLLNEFEDARIPAVRTHRRAGFVADAQTTTHSGRAVRVWRLELDRARS